MKPIHIYQSSLDPQGIKLYLHEGENEIQAFNLACEFCRRHAYSNWRLNTYGLYLLRHNTSDPENLLFALLETPQLPIGLAGLIPIISEYNQYWAKQHPICKKQGESYRDSLLRNLAADCQQLVNQTSGFITGYGSSHVWIAERLTGRRMLIMHF